MKYFLLLNFQFAFIFLTYGQYFKKLGRVSDPAITEISGMVPHSQKDGHFWVHNDSGDGAFVYLIDTLAQIKSKVILEGVDVVDCEDIAYYKKDGKSYLILADMGNNQFKREILNLYIFEEPLENQTSIMNSKVFKISFKYSDKKRDAEALFVDPKDGMIYIISKRDFKSTVFSFPFDLDNQSLRSLDSKLELPFNFVTAADISNDGNHILIKNLTNIFYWQKTDDVSVLDILKQSFLKIPYMVEPQGEAICFDKNKRLFYTISERPLGLESYLYIYEY